MPFEVEFASIVPLHEKAIFHQLSLARGGNQPRALESLLTTWRRFITSYPRD